MKRKAKAKATRRTDSNIIHLELTPKGQEIKAAYERELAYDRVVNDARTE